VLLEVDALAQAVRGNQHPPRLLRQVVDSFASQFLALSINRANASTPPQVRMPVEKSGDAKRFCRKEMKLEVLV
jgi:hypothetical protein